MNETMRPKPIKTLRNAKTHLLNAQGDLGRGLNYADDECRVARGECRSWVGGGFVDTTRDPQRIDCKRCRHTKLYKEWTT